MNKIKFQIKLNKPDKDSEEGVDIGDEDEEDGDDVGEVVVEESESIELCDDMYEDMEEALHEDSEDDRDELVPADSLCVELADCIANFFSDFKYKISFSSASFELLRL